MRVLDGAQRKQLLDALCSRYPSYPDLERFLDHELDRSLARISQEDPLPRVVYRVIAAAAAEGWLDALIDAAVADSPGVEAGFAFLDRPPVRPEIQPPGDTAAEPGRPQVRIVLLVGAGLAPLAVAVRLDRRVADAHLCITAADAQAALPEATAAVVSTDLDWDPSPAQLDGLTRLLAARPVVLLQAGTAPATRETVASRVADAVTQIVVARDTATTARRIVDHLSADHLSADHLSADHLSAGRP